MNKLVKDALILTLITLIAGVALGAVYEVTKGPIAVAKAEAEQAAYLALFPDCDDFEADETFDEESATAAVSEVLEEAGLNNFATGDLDLVACISAIEDGTETGKIVTVITHKGYGGNITISVGVADDGTLNGYQITEIAETPGLGMKSTEPKFYEQFQEIPSDLLVLSKTGDGDIMAISGATISSRAVTNAVNAAITYCDLMNGGGSDE